jgi:hypothetical protein
MYIPSQGIGIGTGIGTRAMAGLGAAYVPAGTKTTATVSPTTTTTTVRERAPRSPAGPQVGAPGTEPSSSGGGASGGGARIFVKLLVLAGVGVGGYFLVKKFRASRKK